MINVMNICPAETIENSREGAALFLEENNIEPRGPAETMLPTPVSDSGQNPPTHFICYMPNIPDELLGQMQAYSNANELNIESSLAVNKMQWLEDNNFKIIYD